MTDKTIDQLDANVGLARADKLELWDTSASASVQGTVAQALALALAADISDASANGRALLTANTYAAMKALLDLEVGSDVQAWSGNLAAIVDLIGTGVLVRTADNTWALRNLAGDTGVTITNPAGVSGNPTVGLAAQLVALANLATSGAVHRTGSGTLAARTLTGGTGVTVTNGDGVSGNPTLALHAALSAIAQTPAADRMFYYTSTSAASLATLTAAGRAILDDADAPAQRTTLGVDKFAISAFIEAPEAKTYTLTRAPGFAFTVNKLVRKTSAGTVTVAAKIDGTNITGLSAAAVTTTEASTDATATNSVSATARLEVTLSSPSSAADLSLTFVCTRA